MHAGAGSRLRIRRRRDRDRILRNARHVGLRDLAGVAGRTARDVVRASTTTSTAESRPLPQLGSSTAPEAEGRCPECGVAEEEIPPPYGYGWRAVQRFAVVLLIGIVGGVVAAEISISLDETRMVRQAERLGRTEWTFQRAWPATFARVDWTLDGGFVPRQFLQQHRHDRD